MSWNYRVLAREHRGFNEIEFTFSIHEIYYNKDGIPYMCTEDPVGVVGDNLAEISQTLKWMRKALRKPILSYSDFEEGEKYYTDVLEEVACAKCSKRINRCECEDGFFFKEEEQEDDNN